MALKRKSLSRLFIDDAINVAVLGSGVSKLMLGINF
ncbi:MAG: hypothetical protein JWN44_2216 [Myxococcales bacterium]|nr:hypothetical protein [Myxococcales bacterium]